MCIGNKNTCDSQQMLGSEWWKVVRVRVCVCVCVCVGNRVI
jgi:hypothetical protein